MSAPLNSTIEASPRQPTPIPKTPTGIEGLDAITGGGLPRGRPTLVCGGAGCGKTLLAVEFLVRGATQFNEPGVFVAFEETAEELTANMRSLGFDLDQLVEQRMLMLDHVRVERSEIEEIGAYDLEGLFVRLGYAIDAVGAKRVVLDTVESLFGGLQNTSILRAELRRLFRWLKDKGVTAIVAGERGDSAFTRHGLEEYVSDCVVLLDHRVNDQVSTRRLRIVKYRGSSHGANEYPFLIDDQGVSVVPITSVGLQHRASTERVSSGIPALDQMLQGEGYFRGSTILASGTAGSGKTSVAAHFANAACERGERCLFYAFEESPDQLVRNMQSIGLNLAPWIEQGLLRIEANRSTVFNMEMHLVFIRRHVEDFQPQVVVADPINNLLHGGTREEASSMVTRLIDHLKLQGITTMLTTLTSGDQPLEQTDLDISSLVDSWLVLRDVESSGERNRLMYFVKSRGMPHSNQLREFLLTDSGVQLQDVYPGSGGVLTGALRREKEAEDAALLERIDGEISRTERDLEQRREQLEQQIAALRRGFQAEQDLMLQSIADQRARKHSLKSSREQRARGRLGGSGGKRTSLEQLGENSHE